MTGLLQQEQMLMTLSGLFTTKTSGHTWGAMYGQELAELPSQVAQTQTLPTTTARQQQTTVLAPSIMRATQMVLLSLQGVSITIPQT